MKRTFFILSSSLAVVSSVIGAGFITGGEILFFFQDFSLLGIILYFVCFFFDVFILSFFERTKIKKIVRALVSVSCVFVAACAFAGFKSVAQVVFYQTENFEIFSIFALILAIIICSFGMGGLKLLTSVFSPVVILFVFLFSIRLSRQTQIAAFFPSSFRGVYLPVLYAGCGSLLSSRIIGDSLRNATEREKFRVAVVCSSIISILIFFVGKVTLKAESETPFLTALIKIENLKFIFFAICVISIFCSLAAATYSALKLSVGSFSTPKKILIVLAIYSISKVGFSAAISYFYPFVGFSGIICVIAISSELLFSRAKRRARTFRRRERTIRRRLP